LPAVLVIVPSPMELGLNGRAYEELVAEYQEEGIAARVERPREQRFDLPTFAPDIAIYVGEAAGAIALEKAVGVVVRKFKGRRQFGGRKGQPRRVIIYGPRAEVLRRVDIPSAGEDADD
jgi:hypothetical protein